jgi:hypothetical protein
MYSHFPTVNPGVPIKYVQKPMVGLENAPLHGDMQFERQVRVHYTENRAYNDSLNAEYFATILPTGTRVIALLRLSTTTA